MWSNISNNFDFILLLKAKGKQRDHRLSPFLSVLTIALCIYQHLRNKSHLPIVEVGPHQGLPLEKWAWPPLSLSMPPLQSGDNVTVRFRNSSFHCPTISRHQQFPNFCWEQPGQHSPCWVLLHGFTKLFLHQRWSHISVLLKSIQDSSSLTYSFLGCQIVTTTGTNNLPATTLSSHILNRDFKHGRLRFYVPNLVWETEKSLLSWWLQILPLGLL